VVRLRGAAFTRAGNKNRDRVAFADRGTLFLDEIGTLSPTRSSASSWSWRIAASRVKAHAHAGRRSENVPLAAA
jgi:Sigma-54 interaction domain